MRGILLVLAAVAFVLAACVPAVAEADMRVGKPAFHLGPAR